MSKKSKSTKARLRSVALKQKAKDSNTSATIGATFSNQSKQTGAKINASPKSTDTTPQARTQKPESKHLPKTPPRLSQSPPLNKPPSNEEIRQTLKEITVENLSTFMAATIKVMRNYGMPDDFIKKVMSEAVVLMNTMTAPKNDSNRGES